MTKTTIVIEESTEWEYGKRIDTYDVTVDFHFGDLVKPAPKGWTEFVTEKIVVQGTKPRSECEWHENYLKTHDVTDGKAHVVIIHPNID